MESRESSNILRRTKVLKDIQVKKCGEKIKVLTLSVTGQFLSNAVSGLFSSEEFIFLFILCNGKALQFYEM